MTQCYRKRHPKLLGPLFIFMIESLHGQNLSGFKFPSQNVDLGLTDFMSALGSFILKWLLPGKFSEYLTYLLGS